MSLAFKEFLEREGIDWNALSAAERLELRGMATDLECKDVSLTVQSDAVDNDLALIVARSEAQGVSVRMAPWWPESSAADVPSYMQMLQAVRDADEMFLSLPAKIRERFNHSPGALLEFLSDESNRDEAVRLKLIPVEPAKPPVEAAPAAPSGDKAPSGAASA